MQKLSIVFFIFIASFGAMAQLGSVVTLKNGSELKGEILKDDETGVKLRTRDGSIWYFSQEEVASTEKFIPTVSRNGFYNRSTIGVMGGDQLSPSLQVVNGFGFKNHWEIGLGMGVERFYWNNYLPVFIEGRYSLLNKLASPFVSLNAGYELPVRNFISNKGGFTAGFQIGGEYYFSNHVGLSISTGYRFASLKVVNTWWDDNETIQQINRFEVRLGFVFR